MNFVADNIYHIYNRGNNKQRIFFEERDYIYFINKMRKYIAPHCSILAYVLMPNHFHLLIHADERTEKQMEKATIKSGVLSEGIRLLLSSYTKGVNKQEERTGNLIQQTTKAKCVYDGSLTTAGYATTCFYYIHNNPLRAGLVKSAEEWDFSSCSDYFGIRNGTLCDQRLAAEFIDVKLSPNKYLDYLSEDMINNIW